jgi:hypothetical protein
MKHGVIADERSYYVGFKALTLGVFGVIYSPLGSDTLKLIILYTETIVVYRDVSYETRKYTV